MATKGWTEANPIDWDKVPDGPPPPPQDGLYRATVSKAEAKLTTTNKPGVKLIVELDGIFGGEDLDRKARHYETLTFTSESAFKAKAVAKSAGVSLPATTSADDLEAFAAALVGSKLVAKIRTREEVFQGKAVQRSYAIYLTEDEARKELEAGEQPGPVEGATERPKRKSRTA